MKSKVFFAHDYEEKDKPLVRGLKDFFNDFDLEIRTSKEEPSPESANPKLKRQIKETEGVVALFTRREKIQVGKDAWTKSDFVHGEALIALNNNLPLLCMKEEEVELGGFLPNETDILEFNREKFYLTLLKLKHYIENFKEELQKRKFGMDSYKKIEPKIDKTNTYKLKEFKKTITVFNTGHGITLHSAKLEPLEKFNGFRIYFALDDNASKQTELNKFKKMKKASISERFKKQTFYILFKEKINYDCNCIKDGKIEKEVKIKLPKFKNSRTIEYAWGWSCPLLFLNKAEAEKSTSGTVSIITPIVLMEKVIFTINIEKGHPFAKKNFNCESYTKNFEYLDTHRLTMKEKNEIPSSLYYKTYEVELPNLEPENKYMITYDDE